MPGIKRQVDLLQSTYSGPSRSSAYTASCVKLPAWGCSFWPSTPSMFAAGHRLKSLERRHNAHWPSRGTDRDPDAREIPPFQCCDSGLADRRTIHSQSVMTKRSNSRTARVAASSHCAATVPGPCGDANQHSHANRPSIRICQSGERFPSAPATGSNDARMLVVFGADGLGGSPQDTVADALGPVSGVRGFCDLIELLADLPDVEDDVQLFIVALDVQVKFVARFL
jgi:hypothetical protein